MKLTPEMKRLMSPCDQAQYFGPDLKPDPVRQNQEMLKLERDEQRLFSRELCRLESDGLLCFHWQRTDKAATGRKGTLDFVIFAGNGRTAHLEFKLPGGRLTPEQEQQADRLRLLGHTVLIVRSADEAIAWLKAWLV